MKLLALPHFTLIIVQFYFAGNVKAMWYWSSRRLYKSTIL